MQSPTGSNLQDQHVDAAGECTDGGGHSHQAEASCSDGHEQEADGDAPVLEKLSLEEHERRTSAAEDLKRQGNDLFKAEQYEAAAKLYCQAIDESPPGAVERAVYYGNLAACNMKLRHFQEAATNCSAALEVDPKYAKALMRRSSAFKEMDDLDHALADAQALLKLDPGNSWATETIAKLEPEVAKRHEAMKTELFGKLKDLGNTVLGKFGMSLDNFKADKDPATGSYSIRFER